MRCGGIEDVSVHSEYAKGIRIDIIFVDGRYMEMHINMYMCKIPLWMVLALHESTTAQNVQMWNDAHHIHFLFTFSTCIYNIHMYVHITH